MDKTGYFKVVLHPNLKLTCFVYSQIFQHFFGKIMYTPYRKLSKELKNGIEILIGQADLKLHRKLGVYKVWTK